MPEWLRTFPDAGRPLLDVAIRLGVALVLGALVAEIYRRARSEPASSFTATLVLLTILIAMVTQVIGDNIARAFSLVGALSIVRFRTVVRDTQDTAYVIFAVGVGMAAGAGSFTVALLGMVVVAVAAAAMRGGAASKPETPPALLPFRLQVRLALGQDANALLGPVLDRYLAERALSGAATARQGAATEVTYRAALRNPDAAHEFVATLNRLEGVQAVDLARVVSQEEQT